MIIARRAIGEEGYSGLAVLWGLVYILGPGLFQPLEQEIARATADRASRGLGSAPVLQRAAMIGGLELLGVMAVLLIAWPLGLNGLLDDRMVLLAALLAAMAAFASAELVRGVLAGRHRYEQYGRYFAAEGGGRLILAAALAVAGVSVVGAYAFALPIAFALAAVIALGRERPVVHSGPPASYRELTPQLGLLLVASLGEAFLLNVGPVAVDIVADADTGRHAPGLFLNGLIIARVPLFFFQAVKASLLPSLADLAGRGDLNGFRNMQLRIMLGVGAVAGLATALAAIIGPWIVETTFGDELGRRDMTLMAAAGSALMIMLSLGLGLVALGHARLAMTGWIVAVVVFPIALGFAGDPFLRVEIGLVLAPLAGSLLLAALLQLEYVAHIRSGRLVVSRPDPRNGSRSKGNDR